MPYADKSELKTALASWMARSAISSTADEIIALAEAALNRKIPAAITDQSLTGTLDNRRIDISAYSFIEAHALWLVDGSTGDEIPLTKKQDGSFAYLSASDKPTVWATDGNVDYIDFNCPLNAAYAFRLRGKQKFQLATDGATNWLLEEHPDIYLAACIVWGGLFLEDGGKVSTWSSLLSESIPELKAQISRQNNAVLTVDPALLVSGPMTYSEWANG